MYVRLHTKAVMSLRHAASVHACVVSYYYNAFCLSATLCSASLQVVHAYKYTELCGAYTIRRVT
jgi:hypothetical protein